MAENKTMLLFPDVHVAIGYRDVWDDYGQVSPHAFVSGIPTIVLLHNMVTLYNRLKYAISDIDTQREILRDAEEVVAPQERDKIQDFCSCNKTIIITQDTVAWFCRLALSNFSEASGNEKSLELDTAGRLRFYKALLYCNQVWIDKQMENSGVSDLANSTGIDSIDLSLKIDVPVSEFKHHKDFRTQLYKAGRFFLFCEGTQPYDRHLRTFLAKKQVATWQEYLLRLFTVFSATITHTYVRVAQADRPFFAQFAIDINDGTLRHLWDDPKGQNYLRDHFLLPLPDGVFLPLDDNYLVDKFYQSMLFDFYACIDGKKLSFPDFKSELGRSFSEPQLFYPLMRGIFSGKSSAMFSGDEMTEAGITGAPDYYVRQGEYLYLFEFKDALLSDKAKQSGDVELTKAAILEKICGYKRAANGKLEPKGACQLLRVIDDIRNRHAYDALDPELANVKGIAPIVVTTDSVFCANGVNRLVINEFGKHAASYSFGDVFVQIPLVLDYDTLVKLSYSLHTGRHRFFDLIWSYIRFPQRLASFKAFADDCILRGETITQSEINFLFHDIFPEDGNGE